MSRGGDLGLSRGRSKSGRASRYSLEEVVHFEELLPVGLRQSNRVGTAVCLMAAGEG